MWYNLLLLGYKPVQHVTVLNTVGSCNTMVSFIILSSYGTTVVYAVRCWLKRQCVAHDCVCVLQAFFCISCIKKKTPRTSTRELIYQNVN